MVEFEWDENKRIANLRRHNIDFAYRDRRLDTNYLSEKGRKR